MNVQELNTLVQLILNKETSGETMKPAQYNVALLQAIYEWYNKEYDQLLQAQVAAPDASYLNIEVGAKLERYVEEITQTELILTGKMWLPGDYQYPLALMAQTSGSDIKYVDLITHQRFNRMRGNSLIRPTNEYINAALYGDYIRFLPSTTKEVELTYLRKPKRPFYGVETAVGDVQDHIAQTETLSSNTVTLSSLTNIGSLKLWIDKTGAGPDYIMADYSFDSTESLTNVAYGIASEINRRINEHGMSATSSGAVITVYAEAGTGTAPNTVYDLKKSETNIVATFGANFTGGLAGSTPIDVDDVYHTEIAMRVLGYLGVSLREAQILEYVGKLNNPETK